VEAFRRWETFCDATALLRLRSEARRLRGRIYRRPQERPDRRRLLHRGGAELRGSVTYYVLFFIHLESRCVSVARITRYPDREWMEQIARSATQGLFFTEFSTFRRSDSPQSCHGGRAVAAPADAPPFEHLNAHQRALQTYESAEPTGPSRYLGKSGYEHIGRLLLPAVTLIDFPGATFFSTHSVRIVRRS
jgi:hypothetical protein